MEAALTQNKVMEWVSKGKSRKWCMERLQEEGMTSAAASSLYYESLKEMLPDPDLFADYKKALMQTNLDRLETIVESTISGNTGEKMVALKAIDQMCKLTGMYNDNQITVARNKDGDEIIQITFDR